MRVRARRIANGRRAPGGALGAALVAALAVLAPGEAPAQRQAGTDIVRVDQFIDAPRALFGKTRTEIARALGATPGAARRELRYPGLTIRLRAAGTLERVRITEPRYPLPHGLNVGAPRGEVERVLGEPQAVDDARVMYLYSDGYPDTVEFWFSAGRVARIDWAYWPQ